MSNGYRFVVDTIGPQLPRERVELSPIPIASPITRLRSDVTDREIETAILREFSTYLPNKSARYLREKGFID